MKSTIPTKPKEVQWTDQQWKSIYAKDQDILVAAAAGSGKTAVLVERIIQRIIRDEIDVDRLLVVTFTNASAREMKQRVDTRIQEASIKDPNNQHLKNQRVKIHQAQISTLHSFCLKLIQQHYDVLEIDPNFRTSNEAENILLLEEAIDEVLEHHYNQLDPAFLELAEHLATDRNDDQLREIVKKLYYFSVANPTPMSWLASLGNAYENADEFEHLMEHLKSYVKVFLEAGKEALENSYDLFSMASGTDKQLATIETELQFLKQALRSSEVQTDVILDHQLPARFPAISKKIKEANEGLEETLADAKAQFDRYKSHIKKVKEDYLSRDVDDMREDMARLAPRVKYLSRLAQDVIERFSSKKRERNILDFSDYEHFALRILMNSDGSPSHIAELYREQFAEILVDEYQDTNRVQETILKCMKRGSEADGNLFMVGDVKQSIYKFRQADPSLFIDKYKRFTSEGNETGLRIDLSLNFRSRKEVLTTTNYLFKHMMDESVGEIQYDDAAQLYYGAPFDEREHPLELTMIVKDEESELTATEQEAEYIAQQVEYIMAHKEVYDMKQGKYRKPNYNDIVILERSYGQANTLQQVFKDHDIPFFVNSKEGYFAQTEVQLILSFLRTVDNPLQDIYLVGLMRSVIYQFTEDELSEIRVVSPNDDYFYQSIDHYLRSEEARQDLIDKLNYFLKDIKHYQAFSQSHPVYQLIDKFYNDHYVIQYFSGIVGGKGRRANLYGLFNKAIEFENSSFRGLYQFIRFIDKLIERGQDFGEEHVVSPNDDVVRMMTIHSSKGLEFPFVIYANLSGKFQRTDLTKPVILNQQFGLGMKYFDVESQITFPSLASITYSVIAEKEMVSEEMRLIYVALTRAKEQLFLVGRVNEEEELENMINKPVTHSHLPVSDRLTAKSPIELIYPILAKYQSTHLPENLRFEHKIEDVSPDMRPFVNLKIEHYSQLAENSNKTKDIRRDVSEIEQSTTGNDGLKKQIDHQLSYEYPYKKDTEKPSKQSVSELKRQLETQQSETNYDRVRQYRIGNASYERPSFMRENQRRRANEIGTLMHTVMQHLPFKVERLSRDDLDQYVNSLIESNIIEDNAKKDISYDDIMHFIESPLYMEIAQSDHVYRELPFVVNQRSVDHIEDSEEDVSIIQGMIDLIYQKDGCYYFVDYKTDAFVRRKGMTDEEIGQQLRQRYKIQMQYYKDTLEAILKTEVKGYLYFFKFKTLSLEDADD
ncbi:helicase-exonuclease AddAB subunit AddA [Staphylococcus sp. SQ8-PEA]|uniref:ATP-dependent helicase/nuclease subunit A n=1 Tax=Staphylococcus marylandisciuri TaxID=2981529 RepID=A0ABT2QPT7_9STAP|nr:helicase-exonuclease AddAB subunit AddA [Staphylococcus marylandisciuri]MCU5745970.1 helicase-exonuclease AddAB subunit AddA [Staphylococcus marylandisciuri]